MDNNWIQVGEIHKTKGFKGEMIVSFHHSVIDASFTAFFIQKGLKYIPLLIRNIVLIDDTKAIIIWENYLSKELATSLNRQPIYFQEERSSLYFDVQQDDTLTNYKVYNKNEYIGYVKSMYDNGFQETIEIENESGRTVLIPFVEPLLQKIDNENKAIYFSLSQEYIETFSTK